MFKIGPHVIDPPFLLAPMAGVSEMPYRVLALSMGAGLATTELISAKGIFYKNARTRQYLTFDREKERPYSVQLFGGEVESMAHAAQEAVALGADIVDVNMGCPVKKVTKTGAGSSLLCDPPRAAELIRAMRAAIADRVPITAKIRTGWDAHSINCVDMSIALEGAGCAAVAVHGRTRAQGYAGQADWAHIRAMKEAVKIPIIGNGDVCSAKDARRMLDETGCDAVMVGRAALGNPWIFQSLKAGEDLPPPSPEERCRVILAHLDAHVRFHVACADDDPSAHRRRSTPEEQAIKTFRQHLIWYSRGLKGGGEFRAHAMTLDGKASVETAVLAFFGRLAEQDFHDEKDEHDGVDYRQAFG